MSDFNWGNFKNGEFAVQFQRYEEAEAFLKECQMKGIQWESGECATEKNCWNKWESDTCYLTDKDSKNLLVSDAALCREYDYKIMDYSPDMVCEKDEREFWEGFAKGEIAVRCGTYGAIIAFFWHCGRRGFKWSSKMRLDFEANWWNCGGRKAQWCIGVKRKNKGGHIGPGKEKDFEGYKILDYIEFAFIAGDGAKV